MNDAYTLPQVEQEINETYKWFHANAPGVWPREEGQLGALWALFEILVEEEKTKMTAEEIAYEFGDIRE